LASLLINEPEKPELLSGVRLEYESLGKHLEDLASTASAVNTGEVFIATLEDGAHESGMDMEMDGMEMSPGSLGLVTHNVWAGGTALREKVDALAQLIHADAEQTFIGASSAKSLAVWLTIGITAFGVVLALSLGYWLSTTISQGINKIVSGMKSIAAGDLTTNVESRSSDEIGVMADAYGDMQQYLRDMAGAADKIPEGDVGVVIGVKSNQDALSTAFVKMVETLKGKASVAESIAAGDLSATPNIASPCDTLGLALRSMVGNLRELIGQMGGTANTLEDASAQLNTAAAQAGQSAVP